MKTILFILIITAANLSIAAQSKFSSSCRTAIHTFSEDGSFLSRVEGPAIDVLTYAEQKIDFKGYTLQAKLSPLCHTSMSADACSPFSLDATVSKNGIEASGSGTLGSIVTKNGYIEQAVSLKSGREQFVVVCLVRNQSEISGSQK